MYEFYFNNKKVFFTIFDHTFNITSMFSFDPEKVQNSTMHAAIDILCVRHKQPLTVLTILCYYILENVIRYLELSILLATNYYIR